MTLPVHVDYAALAKEYEPLRPFIIISARGPTIDFGNPHAVRVLNQALYWSTLGIRLTLPEDRLCPPMENRKAYILWLREVATHTFPRPTGFADEDMVIVDIGTGASAVYPLIGCSIWPEIRFIATEMDDASAHWAQVNIDNNNLGERVKLVVTRPGDAILRPFSDFPTQRALFTMCNPPFYSSAEEMHDLSAKKELPARTVYTGAENESITPGGEVAFVTAIMRESIQHVRDRCIWYTSMVGKSSSVEALTGFLRTNNVDNFAVYCFVTGNTRRWIIAWSFSGVRLPDTLARRSDLPGSAANPLSNCIQRPVPIHPHAQSTPNAIVQALSNTLQATPNVCLQHLLPLPPDRYLFAARVTATAVSWTRKARRAAASAANSTAPATPVLICVVVLELLPVEAGAMPMTLGCRWEYGLDRAHFESFAGHIGSKLAVAAQA